MLNFFKVFGKGILYIIGLPFILAFLGIYAVYCFAMFLYMAFRNIIIFFSGGTPNGDMKEDVEAKRILLARQEKQDAVNDLLLRAYNPQSTPIINQNIEQPVSPTFENAPEEVVETEEPKEENNDNNVTETQ